MNPLKPWTLSLLLAAATAVVAYAEAGVIAQLVGCKGAWCEVKASGYEGWTLRDELWGTYPGENFD